MKYLIEKRKKTKLNRKKNVSFGISPIYRAFKWFFKWPPFIYSYKFLTFVRIRLHKKENENGSSFLFTNFFINYNDSESNNTFDRHN